MRLLIIIILLLCLYPYFKDALKEIIIDLVWLLSRPVKWYFKYFKK